MIYSLKPKFLPYRDSIKEENKMTKGLKQSIILIGFVISSTDVSTFESIKRSVCNKCWSVYKTRVLFPSDVTFWIILSLTPTQSSFLKKLKIRMSVKWDTSAQVVDTWLKSIIDITDNRSFYSSTRLSGSLKSRLSGDFKNCAFFLFLFFVKNL